MLSRGIISGFLKCMGPSDRRGLGQRNEEKNLISFYKLAKPTGEERTGGFKGMFGGAELGDSQQVRGRARSQRGGTNFEQRFLQRYGPERLRCAPFKNRPTGARVGSIRTVWGSCGCDATRNLRRRRRQRRRRRRKRRR